MGTGYAAPSRSQYRYCCAGRNRKVSDELPLAYFITFRTYGTWLPGDDRGFTDQRHNGWNEPFAREDPHRRSAALSRLRMPPVTLSNEQRTCIDMAIRDQCDHRGWRLHALNVRTEHAHLVITASLSPERVMNMFKAYATRTLRAANLWSASRGPWSRHGSTEWLWNDESVGTASRYVTERQTSVPRPIGSGRCDS